MMKFLQLSNILNETKPMMRILRQSHKLIYNTFDEEDSAAKSDFDLDSIGLSEICGRVKFWFRKNSMMKFLQLCQILISYNKFDDENFAADS